MSPLDFAFWLLVGLLGLWLLGGLLARLVGLLLVFAGLASLALSPQFEAALLIATGALVWLLGHWHYALRHQRYRSPLARHLFCRWAPAWLDPTHRWALAVEPEPPEDEPPNERRGPA